jgi:hypothetical protein
MPASAQSSQSPFGAVSATFEPGADSTGWLPVDLYRDRYIYVSARVNGEPTDAVIDSGAGATVIDEALATRLGLKLESGVTARGVGGNVPAKMARNVTLQLGRLTLSLPAAVVINLSGIEQQLGRGMPVIVGRDVFQTVIVDVNYARSLLALRAAGSFTPDPGVRPLSLDVTDGRYQIYGQIDLLAPARFDLDTGSAEALILFGPYVDAHKLLRGRTPLSTREIGGVGGSSVGKLGTIARLRLGAGGSVDLRGVPTEFHDGSTGALAKDSAAGLIGAGLLKRFRVVFDAAQRRLYLQPTTPAGTPFVKDRLGLQTVADKDGLLVTFVAAGSPAAKDGWKKGARVAAANGKPVPADYWAWWRDLTTAAPGTTIELTDGTGKIKRLVLAEYY